MEILGEILPEAIRWNHLAHQDDPLVGWVNGDAAGVCRRLTSATVRRSDPPRRTKTRLTTFARDLRLSLL